MPEMHIIDMSESKHQPIRMSSEEVFVYLRVIRKGTNGVSTNGVTSNFSCFDRGTFGVPPLTCLYLPKSAGAYLFPQCVKNIYLCSGLISVDPRLSATKLWECVRVLAAPKDMYLSGVGMSEVRTYNVCWCV